MDHVQMNMCLACNQTYYRTNAHTLKDMQRCTLPKKARKSRDPLLKTNWTGILTLYTGTLPCTWWCPLYFGVEKQHVSNGCKRQNGDLLRSPAKETLKIGSFPLTTTLFLMEKATCFKWLQTAKWRSFKEPCWMKRVGWLRVVALAVFTSSSARRLVVAQLLNPYPSHLSHRHRS